MKRKKYVYWQDGDMWLGYFEEYPDYQTQGESLEELKENLKDIYRELTNGNIPCVRNVSTLSFHNILCHCFHFQLFSG